MSSRSLRLLEASLVSAFVSLGVSAAVFFGTATADHPCVQPQPDPLLRAAIEADVAMMGAEHLDGVAVDRARALYTFYVEESERRDQMSEIEWVRARAETLRQLEEDLQTMRELEEAAKALEAGGD